MAERLIPQRMSGISRPSLVITTRLNCDPRLRSTGFLGVGNRGVGNLRLIGLVGLGPASRVFTFHLLDSLRTTTTKISICPHMTSYSNTRIEDRGSDCLTQIKYAFSTESEFPQQDHIFQAILLTDHRIRPCER